MSASHERLSVVVASALEEAAFLFVEPVDGVELEAARTVAASIAFEAAARTTLVISTDDAGARLLAANVLGLEADDAEAARSASAAVFELANILAGAIAAESAPAGARTSIDLPRALAGAPTSTPDFRLSLRTVEGHPFRVELFVEGAHAA